MKLYFATGNKQKLKEVQGILAEFDIEPIEIALPELQGEPEEIAYEKAKIACERTGHAIFVDDTSLVFNAWNGLPGPYVKHFIEKMGIAGLYKMLEPYTDKTGYAQVTVGFCEPEKEPLVFIGRVNGTIVPPEGSTRFHFDQIFIPDGETRRFSEMSVEEKNRISHRTQAIKKFRQWLEKK